MNVKFLGTGVAVTTPFKGENVDYEKFERHLHYLIANNIDALIINGTTGEGSTLTEDEKLNLLKIAVRVARNKVPVIAGTGTNNTQTSIDHSLKAKVLGVDGIMLITPYYNKTSQNGLIAHFTSIADAVALPVLLYNVPSRTNMTIEPDTVQQLSRHPYIFGLKDATGDIQYTKIVKTLVSSEFMLYSGNDDSILPFYEAGGHGVISVVANVIPEQFSKIFNVYQKNKGQAFEQFIQLEPLIQALNIDVNPIPIKSLVTHIGFSDGALRLPLVPLNEHERMQLIAVYNNVIEGSVTL
ncbi:4-hydroxy-tetrahydrodipicolinate synthase [Macrococcus armenti]|uniref:4-hydroxy-tetrahydrodipicolinate synthase n=1 Tax=Macrococcus armenti TaxID=2875764 RepID=UPI001CCE849B|nr:4-hydroxy-tetrahydrodipicolinate synthase [Macrococcus armenti]UBH07556.1 4-hydroxy-tetrahydrodipicolinate synthase [Macrococcus armenti]UBH11954.1 4-hydroxy-tetrahydrodipicolinate synthase [Macrococcus armenti]